MDGRRDFFPSLMQLREIVASTDPSDATFERIRPYLADPDIRRVFFCDAQPQWLQPLQRAGYFADPPMSGSWPESQYLARIASDAQEQVADIIQGIRTENPHVVNNVLEAASQMSCPFAAKAVNTVVHALHAEVGQWWSDEAGEFCKRLIDCNMVEQGLWVANALFAPRFTEKTDSPQNYDHWYKRGLKTIGPLLGRLRPGEFLPSLISWLQVAVEKSSRQYGGGDKTANDWSPYWRPAIEEHAENSEHSYAGMLVGVLREAIEVAVKEKAISLDAVLQMCEEVSYPVFTRLKLHLINEFADQVPSLVQGTMLDRKCFDNHIFKHEYARLMGCRWDILEPAEQGKWLGWVDEGPDMSIFEAYIRSAFDREATHKDVKDRRRFWKYERLHWIRDHLSGRRHDFYDLMKQKHGEPLLADLCMSRVRTRWGWESPIPLDALKGKDFGQALHAVLEWQPKPDDGSGELSRESLLRTFGQYVAADPVKYSSSAGLLEGKPLPIISQFLDAMGQAAEKRDIDATAVLGLVQRALAANPFEKSEPDDAAGGRLIPHGQSLRIEMASLVCHLCGAKQEDGTRRYGIEHRKAIQAVVADIVQPGSMCECDKNVKNPSQHDYLSQALNSYCGRTARAALAFAEWLAAVLGKECRGFEDMPEVRQWLEEIIEHRCSHGLAVMGRFFGLLWGIDQTWVNKHIPQLFDVSESGCGWPAWNAFLTCYNPPGHDLLEAMGPIYLGAIKWLLAEMPEGQSDSRHMQSRLAEHAVMLYGRGDWNLDDDGPIRKLLQFAAPTLRMHAMWFAGQSLKETDPLPSNVVARLTAMWEVYWDISGHEDLAQYLDSDVFDGWFLSGQVPTTWALSQMTKIVGVGAAPRPDDEMVKRLTDLVKHDPTSVLCILKGMIDRHGPYWTTNAKPMIQDILGVCMAHPASRQMAEQTIDQLGRAGYVELGELLRLGGS